MMSNHIDGDEERFSALVEAYITHLEGRGPAPSLDDLSPDARQEASNVFRALHATWRSEADLPAFEDDPVAQALGFIPARPATPSSARTVLVSGQKVSAARRRAQIKPSEVARRLNQAGIDANANWVFQIERVAVTELAAPAAAALAAALGATPEMITANDGDRTDPFTRWLFSTDFQTEVHRWARQQGRDPTGLADTARRQLLTAARRSSGEGEQGQWLVTLRAVLEELS
jgi:hypothetical protein